VLPVSTWVDLPPTQSPTINSKVLFVFVFLLPCSFSPSFLFSPSSLSLILCFSSSFCCIFFYNRFWLFVNVRIFMESLEIIFLCFLCSFSASFLFFFFCLYLYLLLFLALSFSFSRSTFFFISCPF
jgi:hypothetical protein